MSVTVISPAKARDLTTAANARADLGLPAGAPTDEQLRRFIAQASASAASFCRRTFGRKTVRERFEIDWRRRCDEDDEGFLLSCAPAVRISTVKVDSLTLAPSAYELVEQPAHPVSLFYLRHLVDGEPRDWTGRCVTVEYEAGWLLPGETRGGPATTAPDLPADVERAVIQLVGAAASASGRDMMVKSEDVEGIGSFSYYVQGANAALPHPEAEATLAQYRRMAFA